jgi:hypothetical protein
MKEDNDMYSSMYVYKRNTDLKTSMTYGARLWAGFVCLYRAQQHGFVEVMAFVYHKMRGIPSEPCESRIRSSVS